MASNGLKWLNIIGNSWKEFQRTEQFWKPLEMAQNRLKMALNCLDWLEMAEKLERNGNYWKWLETDGNIWKRLNMAGHGLKWLEMAENICSSLKMAGNGRK